MRALHHTRYGEPLVKDLLRLNRPSPSCTKAPPPTHAITGMASRRVPSTRPVSEMRGHHGSVFQGRISLLFVIVPGSRADESAVSRILCPDRFSAFGTAAIHLGLPLPAGSSGLPAGSGGPPSNACAGTSRFPLGLAPGGVCRAGLVTQAAVVSYTHRFTLTPLVARRSVLCGTVPRVTSGCR
jgi:hypothetical protein